MSESENLRQQSVLHLHFSISPHRPQERVSSCTGNSSQQILMPLRFVQPVNWRRSPMPSQSHSLFLPYPDRSVQQDSLRIIQYFFPYSALRLSMLPWLFQDLLVLRGDSLLPAAPAPEMLQDLSAR